VPQVDVADDSFVVAPPSRVAARLRDPAFWRSCWPTVTLTVYHDRGVEGRRWYVTGSVVGTAELWLEPYRDGTLVHVFLRADPVRPMSSRRLTRLRHRFTRSLKAAVFAIKDELEAGRAAGRPGEVDARTRRALHRRTEPSRLGLAALLRDVTTAAPDAPVTSELGSGPRGRGTSMGPPNGRSGADGRGGCVEPAGVVALPGGLASAVHRLTVRQATGTAQNVVLKRYLADDHTAGSEWEGLLLARRCAVPTPEPVLLDLEGRWFGTPAVVMTALPGVVLTGMLVRHAGDRTGWLKALATTLAAVHGTDVGHGAREDQPDRDPERGDSAVSDAGAPSRRFLAAWPDQWPGAYLDAARATTADEALRRLRVVAASGWPARDLGFCHGDFQSANVLVDEATMLVPEGIDGEARVTGVVDWGAAGPGPVEVDVATCRADLAAVLGEEASHEFLRAYREVSGREVRGIAAWDVVAAARALCEVPEVAERYAAVGASVDTDTIRARLTAFFDTAARRLDSSP